jgi:uncharacterized protein (DUF362 family)
VKSKVSITKGKNIVENVINALNLIDAKSLILTDDNVLIKPNLLEIHNAYSGYATKPEVIRGIIRFLKGINVKNIVVAEGSNSDTKKCAECSDILNVVDHEGVEFVDLNYDETTVVKISDHLRLPEVRVANTVLNSDIIISAPVLKTHLYATVTLSLKNMMGVLINEEAPAKLDKMIIHPEFWGTGDFERMGREESIKAISSADMRIVDLISVVRPHIAVIDAITGIEGNGPSSGEIVNKLDIIIAGNDPVATDAVGSMYMDIDPRKIGHIAMANKKGLGEIDISNIELSGLSLNEVKRKFRLPDFIANHPDWFDWVDSEKSGNI